MKFLFVDHYYTEFLRNFARSHPDLNDSSYSEHHQLLMAERFGTADFYSQTLNALGHPSIDVVVNDTSLQEKWAAEHAVPASSVPMRLRDYLHSQSSFWAARKATVREQQILYSQILDYKPDILYIHNLSYLPQSFLRTVKPHVRLVVGQVASALPPFHSFNAFDLIITSFPHFISEFRRRGVSAEYLPLCFEPRVLKDKKYDRNLPLTFVGSFAGVHSSWIDTLTVIASRFPLKIWGSPKDALPKQLRKSYQGEAWGNEMYRVLASSRITLNRHSRTADLWANNMRLFEATGCGALLMTDARANLSLLFDTYSEIVMYYSSEDLLRKIKYYSTHPKERDRIARAGQKRTLSSHTYKVRMVQLIDIIGRYI